MLTLLYLLFTKAEHQGRTPAGGGGNNAVRSGDRRGNLGTGGHGVLTHSTAKTRARGGHGADDGGTM